jgi:hypothetical protein
VWTVDDALRQYTAMIRWYGSGDGIRGAYLAYFNHYRGHWPDSLPDESSRWQLAEMSARNTAEAMKTYDPVWCDPPMVDLLAVAADTYPIEPMRPDHLIAPDGMILFAKPLPAVWQHTDGRDGTSQKISAISWNEGVATNDGQPVIGITGWERYTGLARFDEPKLALRYDGLSPISHANGIYGAPPTDEGGPASPQRILQAFIALTRTPLVRDETYPASKAATQAAYRAGRTDPLIRRVQLRRPEHAGEELDAARAHRSGQPARGHWVRGHWKQQWYPSVGENRPLWVAGYARGDFSAGMVPGTKVMVASDRRPSSDRDAAK